MLNTTRCVGLMGLACGLALCVVHLRTEQARVAAEILSSQARQIELRRELWTLQMAVARLRTPDQIRGRVERLVLADHSGREVGCGTDNLIAYAGDSSYRSR